MIATFQFLFSFLASHEYLHVFTAFNLRRAITQFIDSNFRKIFLTFHFRCSRMSVYVWCIWPKAKYVDGKINEKMDRIDSECGHTVFGELFQFSRFSPRRTQMRAVPSVSTTINMNDPHELSTTLRLYDEQWINNNNIIGCSKEGERERDVCEFIARCWAETTVRLNRMRTNTFVPFRTHALKLVCTNTHSIAWKCVNRVGSDEWSVPLGNE